MNMKLNEVDRLVADTLRQPIPPGAERRLRNRMVNARSEFTPQQRCLMTRRQLGWVTIAAGAAAAVMAVPLLRPGTPAAWAQIASRTNAVPWARFSSTHLDRIPLKMWISFSKGIFAMKSGDEKFAHFQNKEAGTMQWYRASEGIVHRDRYRRPPGEFGHLEALLERFGSGSTTVEVASPDQIVSQSAHRVVENGRELWEYEFTLTAFDQGHKDTYTVLVQVDPHTRLPSKWTRTSLDGSREVSFDVDYPADGPTSIFALGVPKTAEVKE